MSLSNLLKLKDEVVKLLKREGVTQAQKGAVSAAGGTAVSSYGLLEHTATTFASGAVDTTGCWARYLTDGSGSDTDTIRSTDPSAALNAKPKADVKLAVQSGTANRIFAGLSAGTTPSATDTQINSVGVQKRAGDTNWYFYSNDGVGPPTRVDSGVAVDSTAYTVRVDAKSATEVRVSIINPDGSEAAYAVMSTTLPAGGVALHTVLGIHETAAAVSQLAVYYMELTLRP